MIRVKCSECGKSSPSFDAGRVGYRCGTGSLPWLPRGWEWTAYDPKTARPVCSPCVGALLEKLMDQMRIAARAGRF